VPGDQAAGLAELPGRAGMPDGLVDLASRLMPGRGRTGRTSSTTYGSLVT
jgi:hypothetical protein